MLEIDEDRTEPFRENGVTVPLVRMTLGGLPPDVELMVGEQAYMYERSMPIKGHSAILSTYLREQMAEGKRPLIIERPDRFYVYLAQDA